MLQYEVFFKKHNFVCFYFFAKKSSNNAEMILFNFPIFAKFFGSFLSFFVVYRYMYFF